MTLLQWQPKDFPFREIAYAALCIAAGAKYTTLLPMARIKGGESPFGFIDSANPTEAVLLADVPEQRRKDWLGESRRFNDAEEARCRQLQHKQEVGQGQSSTSETPEFFGLIASGSHLDGQPPGLSPDNTAYWFHGALIVLTSRLYEVGALDEGIDTVVRYQREKTPNRAINAILFSIEHIVLIKSFPDGEVQYTSVMPLFKIESHLSLDVRSRYTESYLDHLRTRTRNVDCCDDRDSESDDWNDDDLIRELHTTNPAHVQGYPSATFDALHHFLDVVAREQMPPSRSREGCFPNEIYAQIINNVADLKTYSACTEVSRTFRDLCLEHHLIAEQMALLPSENCKGVESPDDFLNYVKQEMSTGKTSRVKCCEPDHYSRKLPQDTLQVLVGSECNRRGLLPGYFAFANPEETASYRWEHRNRLI